MLFFNRATLVFFSILPYDSMMEHRDGSVAIWNGVKIRATIDPIVKRSRRDWTARKSIVKRQRVRKEGAEEARRDRDTGATYSVSIGLRDSTCRSYVETIASGTDSLLVCRIASYIVFVLLMRPDLAAFVRHKQPLHINTSGTLPFGQVHLQTGIANTVRISTWKLIHVKCPPWIIFFINVIPFSLSEN